MKEDKGVVEGNKLIAEFMDKPVTILHGDLCYADWDGMHPVKYHTSWDWLMPVSIKLRMVIVDTDITKTYKDVIKRIMERD